MKVLITVLLFYLNISPVIAQKASKPLDKLNNGTILIDNFEDDTLGKLPEEWYNRDGEIKPAENAEEASLFDYHINEEYGNKYLHYDGIRARHLNFPLIHRKNLDIYKNPILSWKWRVEKLPEGGNEDDNDYNDTAASIYVVFDFGHVLFKKVPKSIRYTWSSTLKEGTELSRFFGNQKIVVVQSGNDGLGTWKTFHRNIIKDYRRLFGDTPPHKPLAILILSDGNNTQSKAISDYDDIELKKK